MRRLREDGGAVADIGRLLEIHAALDLPAATRYFEAFDSIRIVGKLDAGQNARRGVP